MLKRRRTLVAVAVLFLVLIVAFGVRKAGDRLLFPASAGASTTTVWVIDNGFHTSLVLPSAQLEPQTPLARADATFAPHPFTEVGWGDARFYIETGFSLHRVLDLFRAAFAPNNPSAVMVGPLGAPPERLYRSGVHRIDLSEAGFRKLESAIDRSFAVKGGAPELIPGGSDVRFYRSTEHFSVLHLCNHWAAERLNAAGVPVRPVLDTVPAGLVFDLETSGATVQRSTRR